MTHNDKPRIYSLDKLAQKLSGQRDKKVVLVGGIFDLLHVGHLNCLKLSADKGEILIVHVTGDKTAQKYKGNSRPILPANQRAEIISYLRFVDYVFIADKPTWDDLILKSISPDIFIRSDQDYVIKNRLLYSRLKKRYPDMEIVTVSETPGVSTSKIIKSIKNK